MKLSSSILLVALSVPGFACTPPEALKAKVEKPKAPAGPPARVDLPPFVKLEGTIPPETHPDHTMRVDGLLARRHKHLGKKLMVKGYLVEKSECPKDAKKCARPHAYLHDTPAGGDKKLLLAGLREAVHEALVVGTQYKVTGLFERKSDDGFIQSSGMLIYESIEGLEVEDEEEKKPGKRRLRLRRKR